MKNKYLAFIAMFTLVLACTKPEDILNDFDVRLSPDFYSYTIQVDVEDLNGPSVALPSDLTVELSGADAAGVYFTDGTKNFTVSQGTLQMFIAKGFEPSQGDPVDFDITFSAAGYQTNSISLSIPYEEYAVYANANLLNLSNLPTGVNSNSASAGVDPATNALAQDLNLTAGSDDSTSVIEVTVPAGIKFLDADGNVIVGKGGASDLNLNILSISDTSKAGQASYPGGTGLMQETEDSNGVVATEVLEPSARFDISMDLGGVPVSGFDGGKRSNAIIGKIYISPALINPVTNQFYAKGEQVVLSRLYRTSNGTLRWWYAGRYTIKEDVNNNNKLYINGSFRWVTSYRIMPYYAPGADNRVNVAFGRYIVPKNANAAQSVTGVRYRDIGVPGGWLITGTWTTTPTYSPRVLKLSQRIYGIISTLLYPSGRGALASYNLTMENPNTGLPSGADVGVLVKATQENDGVTVGFTLECDGAFISPPASTQMKYRVHDPSKDCEDATYQNEGWQPLITFTSQNINNGVFNFPQLTAGTYYDFQALFGGNVVDTCNVEMKDNGYIYDVKAPAALCRKIGF